MDRFRLLLPIALPLLTAGPLFATTQETAVSDVTATSRAMFYWGDYDSDGIEDALAVTPDHRLHLLRNVGDGTFDDATQQAGLDQVQNANIAVWEDFDRDGQVDLFVGTSQGPCHLFRNVDGVYFDVAPECRLDASGMDRSAHWVDYDEDGRLDLHLITGNDNVFFHALGDGTFDRVPLPSVYVTPLNGAGLAAPVVPDASEDLGGANASSSGQSSSNNLTGGSGSSRVAASGGQISPNGGGTLAAGGSPPPPTISGICAHSLKDQSGGCLKANSSATLGMLYPLSDKFFVQEATGNVGIGTASPDRGLHVQVDSFLPVLIEGNTNPGIQINNTTQGTTSWSIYHDSGDSLAFRDSWNALTRLTISGSSGLVVAHAGLGVTGNTSLGGDLSLSGNLTGDVRATGMLRQGNETGTTQAADTAFFYSGMVNRRIASTETAVGSIVAISQHMRLERDGSNGGFSLAWDAGALNDQVAYGTALTAGGTVVPIVFNFGGPTSAGSQSLYTETDVVRLELSFGTTFNIREMTDVTLIRTNGDFWWVGSVSSTVNQ